MTMDETGKLLDVIEKCFIEIHNTTSKNLTQEQLDSLKKLRLEAINLHNIRIENSIELIRSSSKT